MVLNSSKENLMRSVVFTLAAVAALAACSRPEETEPTPVTPPVAEESGGLVNDPKPPLPLVGETAPEQEQK
jgi:uncharacterized lipoprotein YajG